MLLFCSIANPCHLVCRLHNRSLLESIIPLAVLKAMDQDAHGYHGRHSVHHLGMEASEYLFVSGVRQQHSVRGMSLTITNKQYMHSELQSLVLCLHLLQACIH